MNTFNADEWVKTTCVRCGDAFYTRTGQTVCPRERMLEHARDTLVFEHFPRDKPWDGKFRDGRMTDMVIAALRGPVPDPGTGLVPCGCGGKAELHPAGGVANNDVMAECSTCSIAVICETKEEAMRVWNRAMGYKEDEE